jgi:hypothetical protein
MQCSRVQPIFDDQVMQNFMHASLYLFFSTRSFDHVDRIISYEWALQTGLHCAY